MTSGGSCTLVGSTFVLRRHCEPRVQLSLVVHLAQWAMPSEGIQGHAWGTYVALERSFGAEHGIA
jgi:hypothetical protein